MRKDIKTNKVVKALAIGLAASMAMSQPISVMAEEAPVDSTPLDLDDVVEGSVYEAAEDAIEDAQASIMNKEEGNNVLLDTPATLPSDDSTVNAVPDATEAADVEILEDVETKVDGTTVDYDDVVASEKVANRELISAEAKLLATDAIEQSAAIDVSAANTILAEVEENNAEITASGTAADAAVTKAKEALEEAKAATTEEAAKVAVDKAEEAVKEAKEAQEDAQAAYDENASKLEAAKAELDEATAKLEAAEKSLNATKEELAEAKAAVDAAAANAEALKAQVDADATALANSKEAALKAAYDKMMTYAASVKVYDGESAKAEDADNDGIGDEFTDGFGVEGASGSYWTAAREYFKLYMEYIYGDSYVEGSWKRENVLGNGFEYDAEVDNTFTVTYIDENDETQTAYYNYHTSIDPENKGDITIYEKEIATGMTEEVWGKETEEFEDTRTVEKTRIEQQQKSETTSEDALSIDNGDGTYTKLADVQKDTDVVLTTESNEAGDATSVLVKDDNSQLLSSEEAQLAGNQKIVEGSSSDSYEVGTIQVPVSYGTKEVETKWEDKISTVDDLKKAYQRLTTDYPAEDGYKVYVYIHHIGGKMEKISLDEATDLDNQLESFFFGWADRGYELGVYQEVEDTENVTEWAQQQVIVKTTTATVQTTTEETEKATKWYDKRKDAERAGHKKAAEMGLKEGQYRIETYDDDGWFDTDYKYKIIYNVTTTATQQVKSETYSATAYNTNTIETTSTWMEDVEVTYEEEETFINTREVDVLLEAAKEYKYWTERRNTSNDDEIQDAIAGYEAAREAMLAKQDAAAIALAAAQQAQADVEKAQEALKDISVDSTDRLDALARYEDALGELSEAESKLAKINGEVEIAEENYKDAAAELVRFIPTPDDDDDDDEEEVVVETPVVVAEPAPVAVQTVVAVEPTVEAPVVEITENEVPLAEEIEETKEDVQEEAPVVIEEEDVPLAAAPVDAEDGMSWWWLLVVVLLGATGAEMYRRHKNKKAEAMEKKSDK